MTKRVFSLVALGLAGLPVFAQISPELTRELEQLGAQAEACGQDLACIEQVTTHLSEITAQALQTTPPRVATGSEPREPGQYCLLPANGGEVMRILLKWRDRIKPLLSPVEAASVIQRVGVVPLQTSPDTIPLTFDRLDSDDDAFAIRPRATRRDWEFALAGWELTLSGGTLEGRDSDLDLAFWAFLEAALLYRESDHLSNVGFHLMERLEYDDARTLLCEAIRLDETNHAPHVNLGSLLAEQRSFDDALKEARRAVELKPDSRHTADRLERIAEQAGVQIPRFDEPHTRIQDHACNVLLPIYAPASHPTHRMIASIGRAGPELSAAAVHFITEVDRSQATRDRQWYTSFEEEKRCAAHGKVKNRTCRCTVPQLKRDVAAQIGNVRYISDTAAEIALEMLVVTHRSTSEARSTLRAAQRMAPIDRQAWSRLIRCWELAHLSSIDVLESVEQKERIMLHSLDENLKAQVKRCGEIAKSPQEPIDPSDYFGRRPEKIEIRGPKADAAWHVNCGIQLELQPIGVDKFSTVGFGFGKVLGGKVMYNFESGDYGSGISAGIGLGKLVGRPGLIDFIAGASAEFTVDSRHGARGEVKIEAAPKYGIYRGEAPKFTVFVTR